MRWLVLMVVACSSPRVPTRPPDVAAADREVENGCYDCLLDARTIYRTAHADLRVFEVDLLVALREIELGLPPSGALDDARRLMPRLPREVEAAKLLTIVDRLGAPLPIEPEHADLPRLPIRAIVRDYLNITLDCTFGRDRPKVEHAEPLLAYREQTCGIGRASKLAAIRVRVPRFVETSYEIAEAELQVAATVGPTGAKAHLDEARARFPRSLAIQLSTASYFRVIGDCAGALAVYDEVLAGKPTHAMALVGRATCLGNLGRHDEAIVAATRVIETEVAVGEGYYQRAWNQHALGRLVEARADIELAKQMRFAPDVLALAGIIEYDQGDLDIARADLADASAADTYDCTSRWYLALVMTKRAPAQETAQAFGDTKTCYADRAAQTAASSREIAVRADLDPAYREQRVASLDASVAADTHQMQAAEHAEASYAARVRH